MQCVPLHSLSNHDFLRDCEVTRRQEILHTFGWILQCVTGNVKKIKKKHCKHIKHERFEEDNNGRVCRKMEGKAKEKIGPKK
jgi:hypothetical protein